MRLRRGDLQSITRHPLPAAALSGLAEEEEEEVAVCFKAMTPFPSNLQGKDGERFPGASPDRELCNVKCRIILERHEEGAEHQQTVSCLLQLNTLLHRVSSFAHLIFLPEPGVLCSSTVPSAK